MAGKIRRRASLCAAISGIGIGISIAHADIPATWDGTSNNWSSASDWSTSPNYPNNGTPPGSLYDAEIDSGSVGLDINPTIQNLDWSGGAIDGTGTLTVNAGIDLAGSGYVYLSNATLADSASSVSTIGATGDIYLFLQDGATFTNAGALTISGGAQISGDSNSTTTLNNSGTITVDDPTDVVEIGNGGMQINNTGHFNVVNGSVAYLYGTWTHSGTISAVDGSTAYLAGSFSTSTLGTLTADATSTINLTGSLNNAGNTLSIPAAGTFAFSGSIVGGTVDENSGNLLQVNGGTLDGVHIANGDLDVGANAYQTTLTVQDDLTLDNGYQVALEGNYLGSTLILDGSSRTVNLNIVGIPTTYYDEGSNINLTGPDSPGSATVTIGSGALLHGALTISDGNYPSTLINQGTINGDSPAGGGVTIQVLTFTNSSIAEATSGGSLNVNALNWTNTPSGTLSADSGSTLSVGGSWTNSGTIAATNGSTVNLGGAFTTGGIGILTADATSTVNITGTMMNFGTTYPLPAAGTYTLSGGTIVYGTIDESSGNVLQINSGTLDDVHVAGGDLDAVSSDYDGSTLQIQNGLTLDSGHQLVLGGTYLGATLTFDGSTQTIDNLTIFGQPTSFYLEGSNIELTSSDFPGVATVTLGGSAVLQGALTVSDGAQTGSTLINGGTIIGDTAVGGGMTIQTSYFTNNAVAEATDGGALNINATNWNNASTGTISADGGSFLTLTGSWTNSGTIAATNGSTVNLGGAFTTSGIGNFTADATSTVNITGTMTNDGNTFSIPATGTYTLSGGTIVDGTVDEISGNLFQIITGTLNGVHIANGDLDAVSSSYYGSYLQIQNGLTLDSGYQVVLGGVYLGSHLILDGSTQTVDNLSIVGQPTSYYQEGSYVDLTGPDSPGTATVTLGAGAVLHGALTIEDGTQIGSTLINGGTIIGDISSVGGFTIQTSYFTNTATAEAIDGGSLSIESQNWSNSPSGKLLSDGGSVLTLGGSWTNSGTIAATNGSTVNLGGTFTTAAIGYISASADSTVNITGTLTNGGNTFHVPSTGTFTVAGGTILGGAVDESAGNPLLVDQATLNDVHIAGGDLEVGPGTLNGGTVNIQNGVTLDSGHQIVLGGSVYNGSNLYFDDQGPSVDNTNIYGEPTSYYDEGSIVGISGPDSMGAATLTVGSGATLHGALSIDDGYFTGSTLINNGTINSDLTGQQLTIQPTYFTNNGTIEATGGSLIVSAIHFTNGSSGIIQANGGTVSLGSAAISSGTINLVSGMISLGSLPSGGSETLHWTTGTLQITGSAGLTVGPMTQVGNLTVPAHSDLEVTKQVTVNSGGTLSLAGGHMTAGALSVAGGAKLDVVNSGFIIDYSGESDPINSIVALIRSGYAGGAWNGFGIMSSMAQNNSRSYGIGYADSAASGNPAGLPADEIEVMYTLLGDANLDGKVNGDDFTLMATNFNDSVTNGWTEGDFNFSNTVNGDDFVLLANNFNQFASQSAVSAADLQALETFAAANGISVNLTSVPEPASAGLLVAAGLGVIGRRRRKAMQAISISNRGH